MKTKKFWNANNVASIGLLVYCIADIFRVAHAERKQAEVIKLRVLSNDPWKFEKDLNIFDDLFAPKKDMTHMEAFLQENEQWMIEHNIPLPDYYDAENHCIVK